MKIKLKPIDQQVIVITGASSGIGLTTARMAAKKGARLVLAARNENALRQLTEEISKMGGQAVYVVADVGRQTDISEIARSATETYGGFDSWVNNAGSSIYGKLEEVSIDDMRQLFETNFWGSVYGSLEAAKQLKRRGGAVINVGSTLSERAIPIQGIYSASKHALKGFTDALRMELEEEGAPVSVTLIKPSAIDTPYTLNAINYLKTEPQHMAPVYAPETVAEAILHCAANPVRDLFVGSAGKAMAMLGHYMPRLADKLLERSIGNGSKSEAASQPATNAPDEDSRHIQERGNYPGHVAKTSLLTQATVHPVISTAAVVGVSVAAAVMMRKRNGSSNLRR